MRAVTNWRRPSALPPALLAIIAVVGVGIVTLLLLLALNLFNGPGPNASASARPTGATSTISTTAAPGASATPRPTDGAPTSTATDPPLTPPPTPAGSLSPEQALVAHVPEPIRATCVVEPGGGQAELVARCTADDSALALTYLQFATAEDMAAAFANRLEQSQIEPNTGRCEDQETWPAESEYGVGGQITGRRLCTDVPGTPTIFWTDDRLNIMGQASAESASFERLLQFWTDESGPIP